MTTKTNWDLLTDDEQGVFIDALDKSTTDAGICIVDQDIDEVVDYVAKLAVNALPTRLFQPRLPEGWKIERHAAGEIQISHLPTSSGVYVWVSEDPITHAFLTDLLAQEGE